MEDMMSTEDIRTVQASITVMADLEGQDHTLVLEMTQQMLADTLNHGQLQPLHKYVLRYCDVLDGPEDGAGIVADILREKDAS